MHLGTSTAIILAFSFFGDLCGPKKPPEPPPTPQGKDTSREDFAKSYENQHQEFEENLAKIEMLEAEYQDQDKGLAAKTKQTATYGAYVTKHDNLVTRAEAFKAERDAHTAYFEEHKEAPGYKENTKMQNDRRAANDKVRHLLSDYHTLIGNVRHLDANTP